ncbi:MAG: type II toxin-antitoxin system RelE/ParE family toxin [Candidatus Bathyarchaeia archaeon]
MKTKKPDRLTNYFTRTEPYVGKPLRGDWKGVYSLRIGTYRILYSIRETNVNLLFIGHRRHIYQ